MRFTSLADAHPPLSLLIGSATEAQVVIGCIGHGAVAGARAHLFGIVEPAPAARDVGFGPVLRILVGAAGIGLKDAAGPFAHVAGHIFDAVRAIAPREAAHDG